ncbi:hypothetical protein VIGAN_03281800 [Vigna angularis var. angularis]|uniref:Uncharacterized protein n=1 Tax=Vigna angularis var. angularis TaxID=157739 RepID=A0A0S3RQ69_PHAAN|nr:hypothetical protein VIGAN_03281800 [Vigna angularis var. angularis]
MAASKASSNNSSSVNFDLGSLSARASNSLVGHDFVNVASFDDLFSGGKSNVSYDFDSMICVKLTEHDSHENPTKMADYMSLPLKASSSKLRSPPDVERVRLQAQSHSICVAPYFARLVPTFDFEGLALG